MCNFEGCGKPYYARGFCNGHYREQWNKGAFEGKQIYRPQGLNLEECLRYTGWEEVQRVAGLGPCYEWLGFRDKRGYGAINYKRFLWKTHRAAYKVWVGKLDDSLVVRHKCDNPPCINPEHLIQGTQADNVADMLDRKRRVYPKGDNAYDCKVDQAMCQVLRDEYASGRVIQQELADKHGLGKHTVWNHINSKCGHG